ncbi:MAG TPA: cardiolipin synthase ClsB [Burkholderiaceae bacterium]|nr:cardiolipin synthase ClsB [Burkholderiaceae bacterium]
MNADTETAASTPKALRRLSRIARGFGLEPPGRPVAGNEVELLVNGEHYFPGLLAALEGAKRSIWLETYLFAQDDVGRHVAEALGRAARRGVDVRIMIDGYGSAETARSLVHALGAEGAHVRVYRPPRWWRLGRKLLRRLHRKMVIVDDKIAFIGGINIIDDHNHPTADRHGTPLGPRFDFAVRLRGPIVRHVLQAARHLWWTVSFTEHLTEGTPPSPPPPLKLQPTPPLAEGATAQLLLRDNLRNRHSIERAYLKAIESAHHDVLIACAYFLPGLQIRAALRAACRRGVRVRLLLQGQVEYAIQHYAQRALYADLLAGGIEIYEYHPSYLHAKVAVIDGAWATVGSSNIDPYSLLLAREANVVIFDARFAMQLQTVLERAIASNARRVHLADYTRRGLVTKALDAVAYLLVRLAVVVFAQGRGY